MTQPILLHAQEHYSLFKSFFPSGSSLHEHRFPFKEDWNWCLEKGDNFIIILTMKLLSRKASYAFLWTSNHNQHGTCWLCQQNPEKTTTANWIWASPVVILKRAICSSTLPCVLPNVSLGWGQTFLWHDTGAPSALCTEPEEKGAQFD